MAKPAVQRAKKRKRDADEGDGGDFVERLAAYGESFLRMFDDHDSDQDQAAAAGAAQQQPAAMARTDSGSGSEGASDSDGGSDGSDSSGDSDQDSDGGEEQPGGVVDVVEHIFDGRRSSAGAGNARRGAGPAGGAGGMPRTPAAAQQAQQDAELARLKLERKRFMSAKAAVITSSGGQLQQPPGRRRHSSGGVSASGTPLTAASVAAAAAAAEGEGVSREEFMKMQQEVQLLGASALDKKSRKRFEAEQLARIGAKAEARPRIPASIGKGMAKKQAQRDERALQEGIAAGMIQQKGLGKKKRREKARQMDRGLNEDRGAFRPGILRVKPPPAAGSGGSKGGGSKARRR